MEDGRLQIKDQVHEYIFRGDSLESSCYLDYFLDTYDGKTVKPKTSNRGRPPSDRVLYRDGYGKIGHCRILRQPGHETMPLFLGQWFPKRDEENVNGLFEASILALLKPWRSVKDLKQPTETFRTAFDAFVDTATEATKDTIANVEFFHESSDGARKRTDVTNTVVPLPDAPISAQEEIDEQEASDNLHPISTDTLENVISEQDILNTLDRPCSSQESLYAELAIEIGVECGALREPISDIAPPRDAFPATVNQQTQFCSWKSDIDRLSIKQADDLPEEPHADAAPGGSYLTVANKPLCNPDNEPSVSRIVHQKEKDVTPETGLNKKQQMVHNIIAEHLRAHLDGKNPVQRLLIVHGQGGTGKSTLLNAISRTFADMNASSLLAKTAMTGVAASVIGGQTLHNWAALPINTPQSDNWIKKNNAKRKKNVEQTLWLMIDEMSMLTSPLLANLSKIAGFIRKGNPAIPFGGLCIVLFGDFHQFPPVASISKELYNSTPPNANCQLGRSLYLQFESVVILNEQMRLRDPEWNAILNRSRTGDCTTDDIDEIRKLVLTNPACTIPDFSQPPWDNTILVTPRNSVRCLWNEKMLCIHCRNTRHSRYIFYAEDTCARKPLSREQRLAIAHLKLDRTNHLPNKLELAISMKAMILDNIATEIDLANGSRGVIIDIILDPNEDITSQTTDPIILRYPPSVILFAPFGNRQIQLPGLSQGVVPLFPSCKKFKLGRNPGITVDRRQLSLTPAYAFTDFKSQGQTIENVIVDLAKTPTGALTGFNAYVALSRSRRRNTIRLLRDFDPKLFTIHPNEKLREEDERLNTLAQTTIERYNSGDFGHFPFIPSIV